MASVLHTTTILLYDAFYLKKLLLPYFMIMDSILDMVYSSCPLKQYWIASCPEMTWSSGNFCNIKFKPFLLHIISNF